MKQMKRRMEAGRENLKADDELAEMISQQQQRGKHQSSPGATRKGEKLGIEKSPSSCRDETSVNEISPLINATKADNPEEKGTTTRNKKRSPRISKRKLNNSGVFKKAEKTIKSLELEIAGKRGYTMCLKQLVMEEATVMETAIQEMETRLGQTKRKKEILSLENHIMEQLITRMLAVFEAEDHLV